MDFLSGYIECIFINVQLTSFNSKFSAHNNICGVNFFGMRIALFSIVFVFASLASRAQADTLSLSVDEAEKNLLLLASKYNVDASVALIRQAKFLDNPLLLTDQTLYDGKFFRHSKQSNGLPAGQVYVQVQQIIRQTFVLQEANEYKKQLSDAGKKTLKVTEGNREGKRAKKFFCVLCIFSAALCR